MEPNLDRLQRWMQAVVTHPGGIRPGVASAEASNHLEVDFNQLESVVSPSSMLSGAERLAIYSRSYHARLIQCFQAMFPALLHALGEELFDHFVIDYLQTHPPHRYTLSDVADEFPRHLAETRPDADAPSENRESWPDFIIDLARWEWTFLKVYDGPGVEGKPLPDASDVLVLPLEQLLELRPRLVPCLRLFAFRYPAHTYWLSVRRDESPARSVPEPAECFVAMTRQNYRVRLHELSAAQYPLLEMFDGRRTLAEAVQPASLEITLVRDWLCQWAAKGFFESLHKP
jgi:hypothetical protein